MGEGASSKPVSLGCSETPRAKWVAQQWIQWESARGNQVFQHGLSCPVQGAWAVRQHGAEYGIFVEEIGNRIHLYHFDSHGIRQPLEPPGRFSTTTPPNVEDRLLSPEQWGKEIADRADFRSRPHPCRVVVAVEGDEVNRETLSAVLRQRGCRVQSRWRSGIPSFWMEQGGFRLFARDEQGVFVDSGQLLAVVTLIEMEQGEGRVALPWGSSAAAELVAAGHSGTVLHIESEEKEAQELYIRMPWLREAPSAAARICTRMGTARQTLHDLLSKTPRFNAWKRDVIVPEARQRFLSSQIPDETDRVGIRLHVDSSWVHILPHPQKDRIQIFVEGPDLEQAEELCDWYVHRVEQWRDREKLPEDSF